MKIPLFVALSLVSLFASANEPVTSAAPAVTAEQSAQYDYSEDLDIAKVVRITNASNPANPCAPVKAQMEYVDSKGVTHKLEYTRLGDACEHS
ncbi:MAG: DUF2790 domain-containing protein [Janthinobacterium lividum]